MVHGLVAAEAFAAVHPSNNRKLAKDLQKLVRECPTGMCFSVRPTSDTSDNTSSKRSMVSKCGRSMSDSARAGAGAFQARADLHGFPIMPEPPRAIREPAKASRAG
jgi:hypothetical protein